MAEQMVKQAGSKPGDQKSLVVVPKITEKHVEEIDFFPVEEPYSYVRVLLNKKTAEYIYILEFKMGSAESAVQQIKEKKYCEPFLNDKREIMAIGIGFDTEKRNIGEWLQVGKPLLQTV